MDAKKCVDVWDFVGPVVESYPCNGGANQQWEYHSDDKTLRSTGKCLTVQPTYEYVEVWAGPLLGGKFSVVLFNRASTEQSITVDFADDLDLAETTKATVRDLWAHADMGTFIGQYSATVPSHGASFITVSPKLGDN